MPEGPNLLLVRLEQDIDSVSVSVPDQVAVAVTALDPAVS